LLTRDTRLDRLQRITFGIDILGILALGIARACHERSTRTFADHHRLAALFAGVLRRPTGQNRLALGVEVHRRPALWIAAAAQECSPRSHPLQHRLATGRTGMLGHLRGRLVFAFALLGVIALRIARAAQESTAGLPAIANHHRLAAL